MTKLLPCIFQNAVKQQTTFLRQTEVAARCIKPFIEWQPGDLGLHNRSDPCKNKSPLRVKPLKKKKVPVGGQERRKFRMTATAAWDSWDEIKNSKAVTRWRLWQSAFFIFFFFYCRCPRFTYLGLLFIISTTLQGSWGKINTTSVIVI